MNVNVLRPGCWQNARVSGDLVRVLSTSSILEGEIAKSLLEEEGIPVLLKGGGGDPYQVGPVHVFVPADVEVQARLVLARRSEGEGAAEVPEDPA